MTTNRDFVLRRLQTIVDDEEEAILVDEMKAISNGMLHGHTVSGSSRVTLERHRVTKEGVRRAAAKMSDEVRAIVGSDAPSFVEDLDEAMRQLVDRLLEKYRQGLGPTRDQLANGRAQHAQHHL